MANRGVVCKVCAKKVSRYEDILQCSSSCGASFHISCAGETIDEYNKMLECKELGNWKCSTCSDSNGNKFIGKDKPTAESAAAKSASQPLQPDNPNLGSILAEMSLKLNLLPILQESLNNVSAQIMDISQTLHSLQHQINDANSNIACTDNRVSILESSLITKEEEIKVLNHKVNLLDQYSRNKNIELNGVIESPNEDLIGIINKIAERINMQNFHRDDIEIVHRIPTRNTTAAKAIVQFTKRSVRNAFLNQGKRIKLCNKDIIPASNSSSPIYVNEHLSPVNKNLLWKAKKTKAELQYRYLYTYNGIVHLKKDDASPAIKIHSEADLPLR